MCRWSAGKAGPGDAWWQPSRNPRKRLSRESTGSKDHQGWHLDSVYEVMYTCMALEDYHHVERRFPLVENDHEAYQSVSTASACLSVSVSAFVAQVAPLVIDSSSILSLRTFVFFDFPFPEDFFDDLADDGFDDCKDDFDGVSRRTSA